MAHIRYPQKPVRRLVPGVAQRGSALIEVLVALLLFSFGVLGLVGLQGVMVRNQTDAKFRADAAFLANEIIGLAQTDAPNWTQYQTTPSSICSYTKCADWVAKVGRGLPSGTATVVFAASVDGMSATYGVTLNWTMPDGTVHKFVSTSIVSK